MTDPLTTLERLFAEASERPWFIVGPPWNEGPPYINAGSEDPHGGSFVCDFVEQTDVGGPVETRRSEDDAALIVALVNAAPHLIAVAQAADEWIDAVERTHADDRWTAARILSAALAGLRAHLGETEA